MALRPVFAALEYLLGLAACVTAGVGLATVASRGDRTGLALLLAAGLFLIAAGVGLHSRQRWLVVVGALPVALLALLMGAVILLGSWAWGPQQAGKANLLALGLLLLAVLEVASVFVRLRPRDDEITR